MLFRALTIFVGFIVGSFVTYHVMDVYKYAVVNASVLGEKSVRLSILTSVIETKASERDCLIVKEMEVVASDLVSMKLKADILTEILYGPNIPAVGFKDAALKDYKSLTLPKCQENA